MSEGDFWEVDGGGEAAKEIDSNEIHENSFFSARLTLLGFDTL